MKFEGVNTKVSVDYVLSKRNKEGLGTDKENIGDVWKTNKTGQIYKDNFFYVEPDFGWITGIAESKNIKSLIKGVGMKVISNKGENLVADKDGIKWSDLRNNPSWSEKRDGEQSKKKDIRVQRVVYSQTKGDKGQLIDMSKGTCVVNIGEVGKKDVYLIIGFADLSKTESSAGGERISWNGIGNNFLSTEYGCEKIGHPKIDNWRLVLDNSWKRGGQHVAGSQSLVMLGNDKGIYKLGSKKEGHYVVGVVLGLAVNKAQMITGNGTSDWEQILNDRDSEWEKREWRKNVNGCFGSDGGENYVKIKENCFRDKKRINAFDSWKANISLTYNYKSK